MLENSTQFNFDSVYQGIRTSQVALMVKKPPANAGGAGSIPGWRISPWRRAWQPTPVFLLGDSMDRGAWWATVHRIVDHRT